jgi:hypothetical protein
LPPDRILYTRSFETLGLIFQCQVLPILGSLGIAGRRGEIGGVGLASPAQHPHIFPYFPVIPNEPYFI